MLPKCPRCNLANSLATARCRSCGYDLSSSSGLTGLTVGPRATIPAGGSSWWEDLLGWKTIDGRVVSVDPVCMASPDFDWSKLILKILLFTVLVLLVGPILIGIALCLMMISLLLSVLFPKSKSKGFAFDIIHQITGFFFSLSLNKKAPAIPVRDFRLLDAGGDEYLVRIKGDVVTGSIKVGDELSVTGVDDRGTLMFRHGWNQRIRSEIRIKNR